MGDDQNSRTMPRGHGARLRGTFPGYASAGETCDADGCDGHVSGSRTLGFSVGGKELDMLVRLCATHLELPMDDLITLLPALREMVGDYQMAPPASPGHLTAGQVLDLHADLQRSLARPGPDLRRVLTDYAAEDARRTPAWAANHLHPSVSPADLGPWLDSLGTDLFGATTYQVTAEMTDVAEAMRETTPGFDEILDEELPSPWGFMWLDKPVPRPSVDDGDLPPLMMHAVSWARVPAVTVTREGEGRSRKLPAIRIREWAWNDSPRAFPRPLGLIGQSTVPVAGGTRTTLTEHWTVHMLWILMGMDIVTDDTGNPGRPARKRAANLRHQDVRVVRLRRAEHAPGGGHRTVDWSCSWLVRGHWRHAPHGAYKDGRTRTWVRPYIKGPDGLPLRAADILYRLNR